MCIFCEIAQEGTKGERIYEDESVLALKDIHPIAPVHILIIPKKHIESINDLDQDDEQLVGHMVFVAKKIAKDLQASPKGYKLLFRVGEWGGQEVQHIHLHLIGGVKLYEEIRPI